MVHWIWLVVAFWVGYATCSQRRRVAEANASARSRIRPLTPEERLGPWQTFDEEEYRGLLRRYEGDLTISLAGPK
jgi:hypothetical protein